MVTNRRDLEPDYGEALPINIGNAEYFEIEFLQSDNTTPVDLSAATSILFAIKEYPDDLDVDAIVLITVPIGDPDHDLLNGKVALKIADTDTVGKIPGKYLWDFRFEFSAGSSPKNWPKVPAEAILLQPIRRA